MPELFKNYMEVMVGEALEGWVKKGEKLCDCRRCRLDVIAFALNRLPAKYVVSPEGEVYTQMDGLRLQSQAEVKGRVLDAIKLVAKKPRHSV